MLGEPAVTRLENARVAVFGIGGVGGMAAEALVRSGIGALDLFDHDTVSVTNLNRQIFATHQTVGMQKVDAAAERLLAINPELKLTLHPVFFTPENAEEFDFSMYDYIVDAIDTVSGKIAIVLKAQEQGIPVISAMGAGNKMEASAFRVSDLYRTSVCPLAKVMRRELKARGVKKLKVVYSEELPFAAVETDEEGRRIPASVAFVPPAAGLVLAGEVVKDLIQDTTK